MDAPNFNGNYPLGGERIGPAWRTMWAALRRSGDWAVGTDLVHLVPEVNPKTARGLLWRAERRGFLDKRYVNDRNRRSAAYRIHHDETGA